jgi:hypothetical protein
LLAGEADLRDGLASSGGLGLKAWPQLPALAEKEVEHETKLVVADIPVPEEPLHLEHEGTIVCG